MATLYRFSLVLLFVSGAVSPLHAEDWFTYVREGTQRNICWPKPYIYADRASVAAPFAMMANNGWCRNNMLGNHHFDHETNKLTTAGELKLQWILTQTPINRRSVFLEKSYSEATNAARMETVQLAASKVLPEGLLADVHQTDLRTEGRSADFIDSINVKYKENSRIPVLPAMQLGGSAGGSTGP